MLRSPSIVLIALVSHLPMMTAWGQPSEQELSRQLESLDQEVDRLNEQLGMTDAEHDQAIKDLESTETQLADIHQQLTLLREEQSLIEKEVEQLEAHRQRLTARQETQRQALRTQLDALYRLGPAPRLKLLLDQQDPARVDRMQTYLSRLMRRRQQRLDALADIETALDDTAKALSAREQGAARLNRQLQTQQAALSVKVAQRRDLVTRLSTRFANDADRLAALEREQASAQRALRRVREEVARNATPSVSTQIAAARGKLLKPAQGPVTSPFHHQGGVHFNGIVIDASEGTQVQAVHPGEVVFSDWLRGFGNLVILDHGDAMMTLYAHLQRFEVNLGQRLKRGDTLGHVGNTGGQPRPGLYFEVRKQGNPINPQRWISTD